MIEQEGVIKYRLDYRAAPAVAVPGFADLNGWRSVLWRLGLIGQDPSRYGGLGYGNLSLLLDDSSFQEALAFPLRGGFQEALAFPLRGGFQEALAFPLRGGFLVTGTQTGHLPHLTPDHYVRVLQARPQDNALQAEGPIAPSSEALTHAAVYSASPQARCVAHGHSPEIWRRAEVMGLPCVAADIAYGTPTMAAAVSGLVAANPEQGVIAMLGHEDGLLAYGATPELACWPLARCLARAFASDFPLPTSDPGISGERW